MASISPACSDVCFRLLMGKVCWERDKKEKIIGTPIEIANLITDLQRFILRIIQY